MGIHHVMSSKGRGWLGGTVHSGWSDVGPARGARMASALLCDVSANWHGDQVRGPAVSRSSATVRGLQERVARALPAEHIERVGGWWLRRSASSSWWRGTVLPHGETHRDELPGMISAAERFYAGSGVATTFQISPRACPADLDVTLAERGYRRHTPMSLQTAWTADVQAQARSNCLRIRLNDATTAEWFDVWYAVHGLGSDPRIERGMLSRVTAPSAYVSAVQEGEVIAVGRAVADTGWAGVFGMATLPAARGRGAARGVLTALADWANAQRVGAMYLQVESDNHPARRLYESTGFSEVCGYHYRSARPPRRRSNR
jgi:GNAT superfamily N-acetyltransferase